MGDWQQSLGTAIVAHLLALFLGLPAVSAARIAVPSSQVRHSLSLKTACMSKLGGLPSSRAVRPNHHSIGSGANKLGIVAQNRRSGPLLVAPACQVLWPSCGSPPGMSRLLLRHPTQQCSVQRQASASCCLNGNAASAPSLMLQGHARAGAGGRQLGAHPRQDRALALYCPVP